MSLVQFCGGESRERLSIPQRKRIREYHNKVHDAEYLKEGGLLAMCLLRYRDHLIENFMRQRLVFDHFFRGVR